MTKSHEHYSKQTKTTYTKHNQKRPDLTKIDQKLLKIKETEYDEQIDQIPSN